ncbi:gephyrin-like molybdotransferase Glp [Agreia sp. VKM Ac-1783]|uniref:molybdopterin molybdotransferase MoeA n=1 Tax=Agreia sp. VKM Ac-1783 TaxID=1938889 RepID=UPI000A2AB602|nr:gephyrin-like molybdotransferase Glp [Agreia sp. VKM Ac-1783]SMQ62163.1 molybdopterin molybdochelatase [Agreia sp. VKM Ac-1783]
MASRSLDQHAAAVRQLLAPLGHDRAVETISLSASRIAAAPDAYRQRTLAHDVVSPGDLPPFDNSQMDGYAVRAAELSGATPDAGVRLRVETQINAGDTISAIEPGTAAPIMTGAPLPAGADAVVPIERAIPSHFRSATETDGGSPLTVEFTSAPGADEFVRRRGSDVARGELLLPEGSMLGPAQLGVIAASGLTKVDVLRRIRVLLIATGHEIREPGTALQPGQIYDSNSAVLSQALIDAGCTVVAWPCRSDDAADLLHIIEKGAPTADLVITVGGVSAGAREVVRDALGPLGVEFSHVAMQPGGPQGLGLVEAAGHPSGIPVVTFPGNPVSALISFEMFVRPALRRLAGSTRVEREVLRLPLAESVDSPVDKHQVRRASIDTDGRVRLVGGPSSHLLHSYAASTALVHLPVGLGHADAGDPVDVWRIDD